MLLSIGMFAFSIPTLAHDQLQRRTDWRHAANTRIGARDASQFIGPGEDSLSLSGTAYAELCDGEASLAQLREMADSGDAWPVVDGSGRVYGAYVILSIDERQKQFLRDGTALAVDFSIDLRRVDEAAPAAGSGEPAE